MLQVRQTDVFAKWLASVRDARAKARLIARIESARHGNLGDVKAVGAGVSEMRVDVGAGYRVYFIRRRTTIIVLLCGGNKSTQTKDIARAKALMQKFDQE